MWSIEKRCQNRDTRAFIAPETVDLLGAKMIGIIGDRRMTKMHRYLDEQAGTPRLFPGLRLWHGGFSGPTSQHPGQSVSVSLASAARSFEGVHFSIGSDDDTEDQVRDRYYRPEQQWLGQRRDITLVELDGSPGELGRDDMIRIEYWNENGVGQETILVFDDVDPVQEIAWTVKGDVERRVYFDDEFCDAHRLHCENPRHTWGRCSSRNSTLAEDLRVLANLAAVKEQQS